MPAPCSCLGNGDIREDLVCARSSGGRRGGGDFRGLGDALMISKPLEKDSKGKNSVDTSLMEFNETSLTIMKPEKERLPKTDYQLPKAD